MKLCLNEVKPKTQEYFVINSLKYGNVCSKQCMHVKSPQ